MKTKTIDKYRDFLLRTGDYRADALETMFIARELVSVETAVYEKKYPEFRGRLLVPKKALPEGATFASYTEQEEYGSARIISSGADDLPRARQLRALDHHEHRQSRRDERADGPRYGEAGEERAERIEARPVVSRSSARGSSRQVGARTPAKCAPDR